jgi:DNA adenine methylase
MPRTLHGYVRRILDVAERIREVTLECLPALEVITRYQRDPDTLIYVDPPYLFASRYRTGIYRHEMGHEPEHRALAEALAGAKATVILSGYASPLYDDDLYAGWHRTALRAGTGQNAAAGWQERTEVLWSNRPLLTDVPLPFEEEVPA